MTSPAARPRELGRTAFTRANPLARLAPAASLGLVNVMTLDPLTPALTLGLTALAFPTLGLPVRQAARAAAPLLLAAAVLLCVNTLAYPDPGLGVPDVSAGSVTAVRLLAVALPGLLVLATVDPVDLADALVQQLRVPARFGYGALASMRLMPLLAQDWHTQTLAARARGASPRGPVECVRRTGQRVLGLLVVAMRRATRLAVALDARGFDEARRATARPSRWTRGDTALAWGALAVAGAVVAVSARAGAWHPFLT